MKFKFKIKKQTHIQLSFIKWNDTYPQLFCLPTALSDGASSHMGSCWNPCSLCSLFTPSLWWIRATVTSHLTQPQWSLKNKSLSELVCMNTAWCFSQCWGCEHIWQTLGGFSHMLSWLLLWLAVTCAALLGVLRDPVLLCWWWAWWYGLHTVREPFCQSMKEKINFLRDSALEKEKGKIKSLNLYLSIKKERIFLQLKFWVFFFRTIGEKLLYYLL